MPSYNYLKDYLLKDEYVIVTSKVIMQPKYSLEAISTNPLNPRPYVKKEAKVAYTSAFAAEFGSVGQFSNNTKGLNIEDLSWGYNKNYYEHEYEIAVVLVVKNNKITVYGEKTEKEIDIVCSKDNVLTPYAFEPLVGHELLIKPKSKTADAYDIVHNITLAKLKLGMHQRMR